MRSARPILLTALLLTACGGEEFQDLRNFVQNAGADMRGKVDPPPELKPYEPFVYDNSLALPDPFTVANLMTKSLIPLIRSEPCFARLWRSLPPIAGLGLATLAQSRGKPLPVRYCPTRARVPTATVRPIQRKYDSW